MSQSPIEQMQQNLDQANIQIKVLNASLEAAKQMVNEGMTLSLQLRTNMHLFQMEVQDKNKMVEVLKTETVNLSKQVLELQKQISDVCNNKDTGTDGDQFAQPEQPPA